LKVNSLPAEARSVAVTWLVDDVDVSEFAVSENADR